MADERTTMQQPQSEAKVARNANGREMSALSYATIYRQRLKEEQVRRISESKLRPEAVGEDAAREQERERRRLAMEERLRAEREAVAARNAAADAVLTDVTERAAAKAAAEEDALMAEENIASASPAQASEEVREQTVSEPAAQAPEKDASDRNAAEVAIPAPVIRRAPTPKETAIKTPPVQTAKPMPTAWPMLDRAAQTEAPLSCVVEVGGGELQMVMDENGQDTYMLLSEEEDGIVYITGDEVTDVVVGEEEEDEDIIYLTEDGEMPLYDTPLAEEAEALIAEALSQTPSEEAASAPSAAEAEPMPVYTGEPKLHEDAPTEDAAVEKVSHRMKKKDKKQRRAEARQEAKHRARSLRETREQEEARLAEEAIRAALAPEQDMTPARAAQEARIRQLVARKEAERAVARALNDDEAAQAALWQAEKEAAEEAVTRANNEKREAQRAAFEAARAAAVAEEEARLSKQAEAEAEAQKTQAAEREAMDASFERLMERVMADEISEDEKRSERVRRMMDADAAKNVRIAAAKAERDSERDRERLERAEDAALRDRGIKDWRPEYTVTAEEDEEALSGPQRVEPRRLSYSRQERRELAEQAKQRRLDRIAAEVALWSETETEASVYAALPEGAELMTRRELRALFREELRVLEKRNRLCTKSLLLLKRKLSSPVAVRAGFEAIVAERQMIETLTRAIGIARVGKLRGHIRPLSRRMAKEIRRERKFLKYQTAIAGYAPVPCDPKMPRAVRKKLPYKIPTTLYRTEEETAS